MKVLYLVDHLNIGGAERSLLEILSRFRRITPVVVRRYSEGTLVPSFEQAGIRVLSLDVKGKYAFASSIKRFVKLLKEEAPDLVHVCGFPCLFIARPSAYWLNIPLVDTFNNLAYSEEAFEILSFSSRCKLKVGMLLDRLTSSWVSKVIAVSESARQSNSKMTGIPLGRVQLIYRGRDPEPYTHVAEKNVAELRYALELKPTTRIVLHVGRLIPTKGHEELIGAIQKVRREFPDVSLLIAGDGYYRPVIEKLIADLRCENSVRLLGTRNDVPVLLQMADVFAFPSWSEGLSGALLEAMFAARPIVACRCPSNEETISHRETGLLADRQSEESLSEAISFLLRNTSEATQMGVRAREDAMRRFHIDRVVQQHEQVYDAVLGKEQLLLENAK